MIFIIKLITKILLIASLANAASDCSNNNYNECSSGSFCGYDNLCHEYSCTNYFTYGTELYIGIGEDMIPPELVCNPFVSSDNDGSIYNGVGYGCEAYSNGKPDSNLAVFMPFNEKCSVEINSNIRFDCYKYAANTTFDEFLLSVNSSEVCTEDIRKEYEDTNSGDDLGPPVYMYNAAFENQHPTALYVGLQGDTTKEFDENLALSNTMYAILDITYIDTISPTGSPSKTESTTYSLPSSDSSSNYDRVDIHHIQTIVFSFAALLACGFLL